MALVPDIPPTLTLAQAHQRAAALLAEAGIETPKREGASPASGVAHPRATRVLRPPGLATAPPARPQKLILQTYPRCLARSYLLAIPAHMRAFLEWS
jgi:hypothetical protein